MHTIYQITETDYHNSRPSAGAVPADDSNIYARRREYAASLHPLAQAVLSAAELATQIDEASLSANEAAGLAACFSILQPDNPALIALRFSSDYPERYNSGSMRSPAVIPNIAPVTYAVLFGYVTEFAAMHGFTIADHDDADGIRAVNPNEFDFVFCAPV